MTMTREQYESLAITDLRAIAKQRGVEAVTKLKKPQLVEAMLAMDAESEAENNAAKAASKAEAKAKEATREAVKEEKVSGDAPATRTGKKNAGQ